MWFKDFEKLNSSAAAFQLRPKSHCVLTQYSENTVKLRGIYGDFVGKGPRTPPASRKNLVHKVKQTLKQKVKTDLENSGGSSSTMV